MDKQSKITNENIQEEELNEVEIMEYFKHRINSSEEVKKCSYNDGYLMQEVFYCKTCFENNKRKAGICFGCSFQCHDGHDVESAGLRKKFKCDCGNSLFENICVLSQNKDSFNQQNKYNKNFEGNFCYCGDLELGDDKDEETDEKMVTMFQCLFCEDWFHFLHLKLEKELTVDNISETMQLICASCCENLLLKLPHLNHKSSCDGDQLLNIKRKRTEKNVEKDEKTDQFVDIYELFDLICKCNTCENFIRENNIEFFLNDKFVKDYLDYTNIEDKINNEIKDEPKKVKEFIEKDQTTLIDIKSYNQLSIEKV
jgi:E3 ubiquitin-protein ligase UBR7